MMLSILQWRLRASTGRKDEFLRSFPGRVLLLALSSWDFFNTVSPLCFPAVNLSHQRRRRKQPQLPPLSRREQMNGRTPGADPSPPKRNSVSLSLPAVHVGAEKPLLLQHLLLALQGEWRQRACHIWALLVCQGKRHDSFLSVEDVEMFGKAVQDLLLSNSYGHWHIGSERETKGGT